MVFKFAYLTRIVSRFLDKQLFFWFEAFWDYEKVLLRQKCGEIFACQKVVLLTKTCDDWAVASSRNFSWDTFEIDLKYNRSWTTMKKI